MHVYGYYDLTTKNVSSDLDGGSGSGINLPSIVAGESIRAAIKFRELRDGIPQELTPNVRAMKALLGTVDSLPRSGSFKFSCDEKATPEAILFTPSAFADMAERVRVAIENLEGVGAGNTVVLVRDNSLVVRFADGAQHDFLILENMLHPVSFIRVRAYERGGVWEHEFRFLRAPVAQTSTFQLQAGELPKITSLRNGGGSENGTTWTEIQRLFVPPSFKGTFRIVRDGTKRTDPLGVKSKPEDIALALSVLADPGGEFTCTHPIDQVVYIEFGGDMKGEDYPLLTVEIFDAPIPSHVVTLNTKTRGMLDELQAADSVNMQLEIWAEMEDPEDEGTFTWHSLFRRQVTVIEAVDFDELASAPAIDWLRPPSFVAWNAFSPTQVSNGQLHSTTPIGDGIAKEFIIDHGLGSAAVDVIILENEVPGLRMVHGTDYSWVRAGENSVAITWLGEDPPEEDQYAVTVTDLTQTSFFDPHQHVIGDVDGLQTWMDGIEGRLARLEARNGGSIPDETLDDGEEIARWPLPTIFEVYPSRTQPDKPEGGHLSKLNFTGKGKGILPALHTTDFDPLPYPIPSASPSLAGLYQNQTGNSIYLPGGLGNKTRILADDEFAACDGRLWYPVVKYGTSVREDSGAVRREVIFYGGTSIYGSNRGVIITGEPFANNDVVKIVGADFLTLSGLAESTAYTVYDVSQHEDSGYYHFGLKLSGTAKTFTGASGYCSTYLSSELPVQLSELTWYPKHYERELFKIHINGDQLRARKRLELFAEFEAAILKSELEAQWSFVLRFGEARGVVTPGAGANLKEILWRAIPALERRIILTPSAATHRFGLIVSRRTINGLDTLTAQKYSYGALLGGVTPPLTADFSVQGLLTRFDTTDGTSDPRGVVALSGLRLEDAKDSAGATIAAAAAASDGYEFGYAIVK